MFTAPSYVDQIQQKYPAPPEGALHFDEKDIQRVEQELGLELPSDFYDYLKIYGNGSFDQYFYIWDPFFWENGIDGFLECTVQARETYTGLEKNMIEHYPSSYVDCRFSGDEIVVLNGSPKLVEFLRTEQISEHTRSKLLALGDHYPYDFYPQKNGLLCFGRTDDDEFFVRIHDRKTSIVMYSSGYYEFDMGITEFIYEFLTATIQLPMKSDNIEWHFVPYE